MKKYFLISCLCFLLLLGEVKAGAVNQGFSTEPFPQEDMDTLLANIHLVLLQNEPNPKSIECFDVNQDGQIAIGFSKFEEKTICVYTSEGDFQYGYQFQDSGSFGVEWVGNRLNIYIVRGSIAIGVNPDGEIESVLKILNTSENNDYWNNSVFSTKRNLGDSEYVLQNDMGIFNLFASSYTTLVVNTNGESKVIYDVSSSHLAETIVVSIMIVSFVGFTAFIALHHYKKQKSHIE